MAERQVYPGIGSYFSRGAVWRLIRIAERLASIELKIPD